MQRVGGGGEFQVKSFVSVAAGGNSVHFSPVLFAISPERCGLLCTVNLYNKKTIINFLM